MKGKAQAGAYGVTRIVLINSGKYLFGDFNRWDVPCLVLVGDNNFGKTTLINALQYLYIDDQSKMNFGPQRKGEDTRRYYFPNPRQSYIIFECQTPQGFRTVVVCCPTVDLELKRFVFEGAYKQKDFLEGDPNDNTWKVREFGDVSARLADRRFTQVKPIDWARCLTGTARGTAIPSLAIVPVRDQEAYEQFREIFGSLLRLKDMDERTLRELLRNVYRGDLVNAELRLRDDYGEGLRELRRRANHARALKQLEPALHMLLQLYTKLQSSERLMPGVYAAYREAYQRELAELERNLELMRVAHDEAGKRIAGVEGEAEAVSSRIGDIRQSQGELTGTRKLCRDLRAELEGFDEAAAPKRLLELEEQRRELEYILRRHSGRTDSDLLAREAELKGAIEDLDRALRREGQRLCESLLKDLDRPTLARAFALLPKSLLDKPLGKDGVEVLARARLLDLLKQAASAVTSEGGLESEVVRATPGALVLADLEESLDLERIALRKAKVEAELKGIQTMLTLVKEHRQAGQELKPLGKSIRDIQACQTKSTQLKSQLERLATLEQDELRLASELRQLDAKHSSLRQESSRLRDALHDAKLKFDAAETAIAGLRRRKDGIDATVRHAREQMLSWNEEQAPTDLPSSTAIIAEHLEDMARHFESARQEKAEIERQINDNPEGVRILSGLAIGKEVETLQDTLHSIEAQETAAKQTWQELVRNITSRLKSLLDGLETMKEKVGEINRAFGKIKVSDLRSIDIQVRDNIPRINRIKDKIAHEGLSEYVDSRTADAALEWLDDFISLEGTVNVIDLFALEFHITQSGGKKAVYTSLTSVTESNGTSITIKVLLNTLLLRKLFDAGRLEAVRFFVYLDETAVLGPANIDQIAVRAKSYGLLPVFAAPSPLEVSPVVQVFIEKIPDDGRPGGGRALVLPKSYHEITRATDQDRSAPGTAQRGA